MSPGWEFSDKIYVPLPVAIFDFGPWRQMCVVKMDVVIFNSLFYYYIILRSLWKKYAKERQFWQTTLILGSVYR